MKRNNDYFIPPIVTDRIAVIGGGTTAKMPSDDVFTIGVNDAYQWGTDVCIWGDNKWYAKHSRFLRDYQKNHLVIGINPMLAEYSFRMHRIQCWGFGWNLGWWGNTGAAAINLASSMGAQTIELYGFDCMIVDGRHNWHENNIHDSIDVRMEGIQRELSVMASQMPVWVKLKHMTEHGAGFFGEEQ